MDTKLVREAEQFIDYLALPEAIAKLGAVRCSTERLLLKLSLSSITPQEAEQRLTKQIMNLKASLQEME